MAKIPTLFLIITLTTLLLSLTPFTTARPGRPFHPCNTLIISTYSFSLPNNNHPINPNTFSFSLRPLSFPPRHVTIFSRPILLPRGPLNLPENNNNEEGYTSNINVLGYDLALSPSFKERSKDILSVVFSLLLGAACGALTAGTLHLIWTLFNPNRRGPRSSSDYAAGVVSDDDDELYNPKKNGGYVAVPAAPAAVTKDGGAVVVAKETV